MRTSVDRRFQLAFVVALLLPLAALLSSGCGSTAEAEASATSPQVVASTPATLDVASTLLVVRRQDSAWKLVRLTPSTGAEQVVAALPFRPWQALASPSGARVLYVGQRSQLAVVDAAAGTVQRISLAGRPIRAIDGATWTSENRFLFGGSRRIDASPQYSALYRADLRTGKVTSFRRLAGGEPSYATEEGSLIYVTRQRVGKNAVETIRRLRSLSAQPRFFAGATEYWEAGRSFDAPLLSPDGAWLVSPETGTDVSVTYSFYSIRSGLPALGQPFLTSIGGSPVAAAWGAGKIAFLQSWPRDARLVVYVYDTGDGSLAQYACPDPSGFGSFDWSPEGDLVGWSWLTLNSGEVYASAASSLGEWVDLGAGLLPVWVQ